MNNENEKIRPKFVNAVGIDLQMEAKLNNENIRAEVMMHPAETDKMYIAQEPLLASFAFENAIIAKPREEMFLQHAILSDLKIANSAFLVQQVINTIKNGPVITNNNAPFYDDRYDPNKKWYLPAFLIKDPLPDGFSFECKMNGVDANAQSTYGCEIIFRMMKKIPDPINALISALPHGSPTTYAEIPLGNLRTSFDIQLVDHTILPFPATIEQNGGEYKLSIKADQPEGVLKLYKFISQPEFKEFCSVSVKGSYFGYIPKPKSYGNLIMYNIPEYIIAPALIEKQKPANDSELFAANEAIQFVQTFPRINYDCQTYYNNYLQITPESSVRAFACQPPFNHAGSSNTAYIEYTIPNGSLADTGISKLYQNTLNGHFLVIPEGYKICLDTKDGNLIPAAYIFTTIDVDNAQNSTATFKFNIAPDVSDYQLYLLKKVLLQNLPSRLNKTMDSLFFEFPSKIYQPETIIFDKDKIARTHITLLGDYPLGPNNCNFFALEFQSTAIGDGDAAFIAHVLRSQNGKLTENLLFEVDSDTSPIPQSAIVLSLWDITGNGLGVQKNDNDNTPYFVNKTLYGIKTSSFISNASGPTVIDPNIMIEAKEALTATALTSIPDLAVTAFNYEYMPNQVYVDKILNEIRLNVDEISDDIIVTTNSGLFELFNIQQIDIMINFINPKDKQTNLLIQPLTLTLLKDGVINLLPFYLPVTKYLSERLAFYSTIIHFTNRNVLPQINPSSDAIDLNSIGKIINLSVSNLHLARN